MSGTTLANIGTTRGDVWDNVGEYRDNLGGRLGQLKKGGVSQNEKS